MEQPYDSTADTLEHIAKVRLYLVNCIENLKTRSILHDQSKLHPPEKEAFDILTPRLKGLTYGSDEYRACLREMKPALAHHYAHNPHHPEHFKLFKCSACGAVLREEETWLPQINDNPPRLCKLCCPIAPIYECDAVPYVGVEGMSLFDVLEMLMDWKAAGERHADGDIRKSIEHNTERFKLSKQLVSILENTVREMGW